MTQILFARVGILDYIDTSINATRPNSERREKTNLNFYFHTFLRCLKRIYESLNNLSD